MPISAIFAAAVSYASVVNKRLRHLPPSVTASDMLLDGSVFLVYVVVFAIGGTPTVAIGPMDTIPGLAVQGTAIAYILFSGSSTWPVRPIF